MSVFVTSDLHLGHTLAAKMRGFSSVKEHDIFILDTLNDMLGRRNKLFVLGDIAWNKEALSELKKMPFTMDAVLGNHDTYSSKDYAEVFNKVYGIVRYKKLWLTHAPIHPQEIYRCKGNVHGHIHYGAATKNLGLPYYNVNLEFHDMKPVAFEDIAALFPEEDCDDESNTGC